MPQSHRYHSFRQEGMINSCKRLRPFHQLITVLIKIKRKRLGDYHNLFGLLSLFQFFSVILILSNLITTSNGNNSPYPTLVPQTIVRDWRGNHRNPFVVASMPPSPVEPLSPPSILKPTPLVDHGWSVKNGGRRPVVKYGKRLMLAPSSHPLLQQMFSEPELGVKHLAISKLQNRHRSKSKVRHPSAKLKAQNPSSLKTKKEMVTRTDDRSDESSDAREPTRHHQTISRNGTMTLIKRPTLSAPLSPPTDDIDEYSTEDMVEPPPPPPPPTTPLLSKEIGKTKPIISAKTKKRPSGESFTADEDTEESEENERKPPVPSSTPTPPPPSPTPLSPALTSPPKKQVNKAEKAKTSDNKRGSQRHLSSAEKSITTVLRCQDPMTRQLIPAATACKNTRSDKICAYLFEPVDRMTGRRDIKCNLQGLEDIAESCRRTCGICCEDINYSCEDDNNGIIDCSRQLDKCHVHKWFGVLSRFCAGSCGLCAKTACRDFDTACRMRKALCLKAETMDYMRENCARTCGFCIVGDLSDRDESTPGLTVAPLGMVTKAIKPLGRLDGIRLIERPPKMGGGMVSVSGQALMPMECVDREPTCSAHFSLCKNTVYAEYMVKFCTKTCLDCGDDADDNNVDRKNDGGGGATSANEVEQLNGPIVDEYLRRRRFKSPPPDVFGAYRRAARGGDFKAAAGLQMSPPVASAPPFRQPQLSLLDQPKMPTGVQMSPPQQSQQQQQRGSVSSELLAKWPPPSTNTSTSITIGDWSSTKRWRRCVDRHHKCPTWTRNGFCTHPRFDYSMRARLCPKSCQLCPIVPK